MSKSSTLELHDLVSVHIFYMGLLHETVGHAVPVPQEVKEFRPTPEGAHSVSSFKTWLAILDMAITPPMVRDALKRSTRYEVAEALLRYYMRKGSPADREKADFVVTFLFRSRKKPPANPAFEPVQQSAADALEFEAELYKVMGDMKPPELPAEHSQLAQEFEFLEQEVDEFRHFDALMDSGIVQRAREIKQALGPSIYHPRVLATLAVYNAFFGARFELLFKEATEQIKTFAAKVQKEGGSIMSRIEGDVIVKHLAEVEEAKLLKQEYGAAMESFRKVSKYKKAVDSRRFTRAPGAPAATPAGAPAAPVAAAPAEPPPAAPEAPPPPATDPGLEPIAAVPEAAPAPAPKPAPPQASSSGKMAALGPQPPGLMPSPQVKGIEDGKIRGVQESIRSFLRSADPKTVHAVPLRNASVPLTPAEAEAFQAGYAGEKSFRADYVGMMMQLVAIQARMLTELADYQAKKSSAYLWKPHADSLAYLLTAAEMAIQRSKGVATTAGHRGLADKVKALEETAHKLRQQMKVVAKALQT